MFRWVGLPGWCVSRRMVCSSSSIHHGLDDAPGKMDLHRKVFECRLHSFELALVRVCCTISDSGVTTTHSFGLCTGTQPGFPAEQGSHGAPVPASARGAHCRCQEGRHKLVHRAEGRFPQPGLSWLAIA